MRIETRWKRKQKHINPYKFWSLLLLATFIVSEYLIRKETNLGFIWSELAAINLAALIAFTSDKISAQYNQERIPEAVLLAVVALGGGIGAIAGMKISNHKTSKRDFQASMAIIIVIQIAIITLYLRYK